MLIRFAIENFLSIRDEQEISLVASSVKDKAAALIPLPNSQLKLLPAAVIYGANASGKSNCIAAFQFLTGVVRYSHERGTEGGVPRRPFLLQRKWRSKPTKCDIEFVLDGVRYQYGFACDDNAFLEEWLYAFPSGKRQTWYLREPNRKQVHFGKKLKGSSKTIESLMRPNSLYLSVAAQNAHEQLTPIFRYLTSFTFRDAEVGIPSAQAIFSDGKWDHRILESLKNADTGISDYRFEDYNLVGDAFGSDLSALFKKHAKNLDVDFSKMEKLKKLSLAHSANESEPIFLDLAAESSGTLRLLILFKDIFSALDNGSLLIVDEIDASLHTHLVEDIITLFNSGKVNKHGAQLLATTHDTNLLCGKMLRRDQIWFAEKDNSGATALYPLTDIRTRNTDNIEKGYLEGRFGAVPFRGRLDLSADQ